MANDFGIDLNLKGLPQRSSVGKVDPHPTPAWGKKPTKHIGDPPPPRADLADYPNRLTQPFAYAGILEVIKRKLNALTGEKYSIVPARGDRVSINEKGTVFVGLDFLETFLDQHAVIAGVLSHEWGHFPTRRKHGNLDHLTWEDVYKIRRQEETQADMFCGRALYLLGYRYEPLIQYLRDHDNPTEKSAKYHTVTSRTRIIVASYRSQEKRNNMAYNIKPDDSVYGDPIHNSKLIGS